jgi:cellulose synthase/poly-beta-1,6-N-acetylglucosamine synthase-like glycosyltransferase
VVTDGVPMVSIIIPARPDEAKIAAVDAARKLDYPAEKIEIILARGQQPSVQRNAALRAARGEIVYFLDDDSRPPPQNLRRALEHFKAVEVKMVGGPNLCPPDASALQQAFALTMGSWLAFGPSRARYRAVGIARESSEKELILCNLLARREAVLELGGFDESLYPNEENALMDALQKDGGKLIYDPDLIVFRHPRGSFKAFGKMLLNYGRGRAEQFRVLPTIGSALNFAPPLFCVYLLALPVLPRFLWWPLAAYLAAVLAQAILLLPARRLVWVPLISGLIFTSHVCYGLGFWRGCFTALRSPPAHVAADVKLERV